jgi:enoyl-CoA hydratase/carnithine racemase
MGLVWKVCEPDDLLPTATAHAAGLAKMPVSSLKAVKRTMTEPLRAEIAAARERENECFKELLGGPATTEALAAFAEGREADFTSLPPGW